MQTYNAIVKDVRITLERDSFLYIRLDLDLQDSCYQSFVSCVLGATKDCINGDHKNQSNLTAEYLVNIMQVMDIVDLKQAIGKTIRIRKENTWSDIEEIGHIIKDIWFNPNETFKEWRR